MPCRPKAPDAPFTGGTITMAAVDVNGTPFVDLPKARMALVRGCGSEDPGAEGPG